MVEENQLQNQVKKNSKLLEKNSKAEEVPKESNSSSQVITRLPAVSHLYQAIFIHDQKYGS